MGLGKLSQENRVWAGELQPTWSGAETGKWQRSLWQHSALQENPPVSTWAERFGQEVNLETIETISSMLFCNQVQLVSPIFCISNHLSLSRLGITKATHFERAGWWSHHWLMFSFTQHSKRWWFRFQSTAKAVQKAACLKHPLHTTKQIKYKGKD